MLISGNYLRIHHILLTEQILIIMEHLDMLVLSINTHNLTIPDMVPTLDSQLYIYLSDDAGERTS